MPIDPNIILQGQGPKIDNPMDVAAKALTLKQLVNQSQMQDQQIADNQALKNAFNKNVTQNPDGTTSLNEKGAISDIYKTSPMKAMEVQQQMNSMHASEQKARLEKIKGDLELTSQLLGSVKDQPSYEQAIARAKGYGLDVSSMPPVFDPNQIRHMQMQTLSVKDQFDQQWKQMGFDQKERELGLKHQDIQIKRDQVMADKNEKRLIALKDDLDPNKARGGNLAKSQAMINSADRVDGLFKQFPDYNIPKAQTVELATAVASLISGGSPQSQHQIDMMVPSSMRGNAQDIASWITNNPQGRDQVEFMKMMHETATRERQIAENQVKSAQIQRLSAHKNLEKSDPEGYRSVLQSYGIDPSEIKNGRYSPKNAGEMKGDSSGAPIKTFKTNEIDWAE